MCRSNALEFNVVFAARGGENCATHVASSSLKGWRNQKSTGDQREKTLRIFESRYSTDCTSEVEWSRWQIFLFLCVEPMSRIITGISPCNSRLVCTISSIYYEKFEIYCIADWTIDQRWFISYACLLHVDKSFYICDILPNFHIYGSGFRQESV